MASTALRLPTAFEEFMEWEPRQPERWEFMEGCPRLMPDASLRHNDIVANIAMTLRNYLRGTRCRVLMIRMKVKVPHERVAYPDVVVYCSQRSGRDIIIDDPVVLIEVLSPSTERYDRTVKQPAYETIPTLRYILLVGSDEPKVDIWSRQADGAWQRLTVEELTATARLNALDIALPKAAIYEDIAFPLPEAVETEPPAANA